MKTEVSIEEKIDQVGLALSELAPRSAYRRLLIQVAFGEPNPLMWSAQIGVGDTIVASTFHFKPEQMLHELAHKFDPQALRAKAEVLLKQADELEGRDL